MSDIYRKISFEDFKSSKINRSLKGLNQILSKPAYIFLMHFMIKNKYDGKVKERVLKYIETLMLRRHVCEKKTSENDDIFSKMVPLLEKENIVDEIIIFINENGYIPDDN